MQTRTERRAYDGKVLSALWHVIEYCRNIAETARRQMTQPARTGTIPLKQNNVLAKSFRPGVADSHSHITACRGAPLYLSMLL